MLDHMRPAYTLTITTVCTVVKLLLTIFAMPNAVLCAGRVSLGRSHYLV